MREVRALRQLRCVNWRPRASELGMETVEMSSESTALQVGKKGGINIEN